MMRKVAAVLGIVFAALVLAPAWASAATAYPPLPVTSSSVLPTSNSIPSVVVTTATGTPGQSLSYTGAGFNLAAAVAIGAAILLVGLVFTVIGARRMARHR